MRLGGDVSEIWERDIVPTLEDFIRIPNVSVGFDPGWAEAGHMKRAVDLVAGWLRAKTPVLPCP